MNIRCPGCQFVFRVDPAKVPAAGLNARCNRCATVFRVGGGVEAARDAPPRPLPAAASVSVGAQAATVATAAAAGTAPVRRVSFRNQDPEARAQRIARALVSDIVAYNKDRLEEARAAGTLRGDFREEIRKSWEEYVEQVGLELAKRTPFFRDALNDILAQGHKTF